MMYPYMKLMDGTEVVHSHILEDNHVKVHFEHPTEDGFDSATCMLPEYEWKRIEGYSEKEIEFFNEYLIHNVHLLYRYAANGGLKFT